MENHDCMATTGARFSRQCVEDACEDGAFGFQLLCVGAGGQLDAPAYLPAGSCNSTEWRSTSGPLPYQSLLGREQRVTTGGNNQ